MLEQSWWNNIDKNSFHHDFLYSINIPHDHDISLVVNFNIFFTYTNCLYILNVALSYNKRKVYDLDWRLGPEFFIFCDEILQFREFLS